MRFTFSRMCRSGLLSASLAVLAPTGALADDPDKMLTRYVQPGHKLEHTLEKALQDFDRLDVDQNGLSLADAETAKQSSAARRRSQKLAELMVYDLDGNVIISGAELETATRLMQRRRGCNDCTNAGSGVLSQQASKWLKRQLQLDSNGDGSLSMAEIIASADLKELAQGEGRSWKSIEAFMLFDADRNSTVSETEFEKGISRVFADADTDHNGVIDIDEYQALHG